MSEKKARTRIGTTMTKVYIDAIDHLVDEGLYLSRGEVMLDALRLLFKSYGIEPFTVKEPELEAADQEDSDQEESDQEE